MRVPTAVLLSGLYLLVLSGQLPTARAQGDERTVAETAGDPADEVLLRYQRNLVNLNPVARIEALLGFVRLHPDSRHIAQVHQQLRSLAARLKPAEEQELIALLAFQQLPAQVATLDTPSSRADALKAFRERYPEFFKQEYRQASLDVLARRLGAVDTPPPAPARPEQPGPAPWEVTTALPEPVSVPAPGPGESTAEPPVAVHGEAVARSPSQHGAPLPPAEPAEPRLPGPEPEAVTMKPPEPQPDSAVKPARPIQDPFVRWEEATKGMNSDASLQLWTVYLLLYPDSPHRARVEARIADAGREIAGKEIQADLARQERQKKREEDRKKLDKLAQESDRRALRRKIGWSIAGGLTGVLLLVILGASL